MAYGAERPPPVWLCLWYPCLGTGGKAGWKKGVSVFNRRYDKWGGVAQEEVQQVGRVRHGATFWQRASAREDERKESH